VLISSLESEITRLSSLQKAKECEWNAILRLKKLKEVFLGQLKRRKEMLFQLDSLPGSDTEIRTLVELMSAESKKIGAEEPRVIKDTEKLLNDSREVEHEIKNITLCSEGTRESASSKYGPLQLERRNASMALQELCERNRSQLSEGISNKIIGEGRQGPVLEVKSIIAEHR
jgi:hypothetical protein